MHALLGDLRYAVRMLRKAPISTLVAVLSLGFAIATNTTTFSVASSFLLRSFRWQAPEEIVFVTETTRSDVEDRAVTAGNFLDWKESSRHLAALEAYSVHPANLTGDGRPDRIDAVEATPGIFDLLGRTPALGRLFSADEAGTPERRARVGVLTDSFFQHRFGADPAILGSSLLVDGEPVTVIGVMPPDFDFIPADVEIFRPVDLAAHRHDRADHAYVVLGRRAPGSDLDQVKAELQAVAARLADEHPDTNRGTGVRVQALSELFPGPTDTRLQYILLTVAAFVLVIASANLVNLFLARGDLRREEIALRMALGAGQPRLARQLLTESLLVGLVGGALGIVASILWVRQVQGFMPAELPDAFMPRIDVGVIAYGILVSLVAGALLGAAPALQAAKVEPAAALGETSRGGSGSRRRRRLRAGFIVAETAVALALLTGAGMLTDTFDALVEDSGAIDVDGVLTLELTADQHRFPEEAGVAAFYREVKRRLLELPGAQTATVLSTLPRSRTNPRTQFTIDGRPAPSATEAPWTSWQVVGADYFETLRAPMLAGRTIRDSDREDAAPVAVVNQSFARLHFPGEEAIGRHLTIAGASREIVGVCADFRQSRMPETEGPAPAVYVPFEQHPLRTASLAVRLAGDPEALLDAAREAVWKVDPDQPVTLVTSLRAHIDTSLAGPRVIAQALTLIGSVALILAAIGIYGLIAHDVAQRRREIGIRMALGAGPRRVLESVTLRGLAITGLGTLIGLPMAWGMSRAIDATLAGFAPVDFGRIALLVVLLSVISLLASAVPGLRASRIRPARVLQAE